eukprot:scaffold71136_cov15-Prasinocladus_malaysianus.AAC.1
MPSNSLDQITDCGFDLPKLEISRTSNAGSQAYLMEYNTGSCVQTITHPWELTKVDTVTRHNQIAKT